MNLRFLLVAAVCLASLFFGSPFCAADDAPQKAVAVHEKLQPLAWLIGTWEGGFTNFAGGKIRYLATNKYTWVLDGQAMLERWCNRNADGEITDANYTLIFVDPETGALRQWGVSANGHVNTGTSTKVDPTASIWDLQLLFPTGELGTFQYRMLKSGNDEFQKGWSKTSGKGGNVSMTFRRLSKEEASNREIDEKADPSEQLRDLAWVAGEWTGRPASAEDADGGVHEQSTHWMLRGKVMLDKWKALTPDGTVGDQGLTLYYMNPATQSPEFWTLTRNGHVGLGKLQEVSEDGITWRVRVLWSDGGQAHYTHALSRDGADTYKSESAKISGSGVESFGTKVFQRDAEQESASQESAASSG